VSARGVRGILADYVRRPAPAFAAAQHGFHLDAGEQRRRYVIQSVLHADGLSLARYQSRFGTNALDDLPQLGDLAECGLAELTSADAGRSRVAGGDMEASTSGTCTLRLTPAGVERSDAVGPWLYSARVQQLIDEYEVR
jgi:oxygen-independent coproporphyrinogen-3 oxidase